MPQTSRFARSPLRMIGRAIVCVALAGLSAAHAKRPLTIDDVMNLSTLAQVAPSPDGDLVASVVVRGASQGGVFGRTFYEIDPTRADIWLTSRRTGQRQDLTEGQAASAGFWCATWSPDGRRLAMLSTKPEGAEPKGGDNVRLYVWDRDSRTISRISNLPIATQSLGGSALYQVDLRGGAAGSGATHDCGRWSNAPFLWLDDSRLLALTLPPGAVSGLLDSYTHGYRHAALTAQRLAAGDEPTVTAVGSGAERIAGAAPALMTLTTFELAGGARSLVAIPDFPFRGALQIFVAPDRREAAVLAVTGQIQPAAGKKLAYSSDAWSTEKRLGFVDLTVAAPVRWFDTARIGNLFDLLAWSPTGKRLAFRTQPDLARRDLALFTVSPRAPGFTRLSPAAISIGGGPAGTDLPADTPLLWIDDDLLVARAVAAGTDLDPFAWHEAEQRGTGEPRVDWWLLGGAAAPANLTAAIAAAPATLWRAPGANRFQGFGDGRLWSIDPLSRSVQPIAAAGIARDASLIWPRDLSRPVTKILLSSIPEGGEERGATLAMVDLAGAASVVNTIAPIGAHAGFAGYDPAHDAVFRTNSTYAGTFVEETDLARGKTRRLLAINEALAGIDWGANMLADYQGEDGQRLHAGVILPPGYVRGRKYPTLFWVYAGATVHDLTDSMFEPDAAAFYNLYLYAAHGYVVVSPSMPLQSADKRDDFMELPKGAMPAVSRLVDLGIADPDRLAVMGQSYGGYSVYSLLTYTNRFKAGIAMAGLVDEVNDYNQFDASARGYPGIEHEKSDNWGLADTGQGGMGGPPYEDMWHYWRNSPLNYVDRVETPLLLIHGEQDIRSPMSQAEAFFFSLYRRGKIARLLRYWGEDHGLRLSQANARDIYRETVAWLDKYVGSAKPGAPGAAASDLAGGAR